VAVIISDVEIEDGEVNGAVVVEDIRARAKASIIQRYELGDS
jgi:hypothetical protein